MVAVMFARTFSVASTAAHMLLFYMLWGDCCLSFRQWFTGLVEVYPEVTLIVSRCHWIAFRTWIGFWIYCNCIRLGSLLQCYWSGRTWRLSKWQSCHVLLLFDFELIVHDWMLNMFCNLISKRSKSSFIK